MLETACGLNECQWGSSGEFGAVEIRCLLRCKCIGNIRAFSLKEIFLLISNKRLACAKAHDSFAKEPPRCQPDPFQLNTPRTPSPQSEDCPYPNHALFLPTQWISVATVAPLSLVDVQMERKDLRTFINCKKCSLWQNSPGVSNSFEWLLLVSGAFLGCLLSINWKLEIFFSNSHCRKRNRADGTLNSFAVLCVCQSLNLVKKQQN